MITAFRLAQRCCHRSPRALKSTMPGVVSALTPPPKKSIAGIDARMAE